MAGLERRIPRLIALHDRVAARPRIARYLRSKRRAAVQPGRHLPALPRARRARRTTEGGAMTVPADPRPLAGVTVIDMTRVLAGPFCTLLLANLGRARHQGRAAAARRRRARDRSVQVGGKSLYFAALNYGKESIALDLRADADRAVFDDLLAAADVLVENFRPGVLERLGYGWAVLAARWPRARLRRRIRIRAQRAAPGSARVRPRRAGDGRPREPHRASGRAAGARRRLDRRHRGRPLPRRRASRARSTGGARPDAARWSTSPCSTASSRSSRTRSRDIS